jgi:hypothetical protein
MRRSRPEQCITIPLLRYVRDSKPSEDELLDWLGPSEAARYHVLRKAGLLIVNDGVVTLSADQLTDDGKHFRYEFLRYNIDDDTVDVYRDRGPKEWR